MKAIRISSEPRPLGKSGLTVSPLAWGMWRFAGAELHASRAKIDAALDCGITLFDTADVYGWNGSHSFGAAEELLGRVFAENRLLRDRIVLASKGGIIPGTPYDSSAEYLHGALAASLKRLGTDRIDLWQIHRPDILTHPQEVARALEDAVQSGKVRAVGVSNYTAAQVTALSRLLSIPLVSVQPEFSALQLAPLEDGLFDAALVSDLAVLAWSPLGQGRVASPSDERSRCVAAALDSVAAEFGVSRTAAAYGWIMAHPVRPIPIVGTQNPARIREAALAYRTEWTRARWYKVLTASRGAALP